MAQHDRSGIDPADRPLLETPTGRRFAPHEGPVTLADLEVRDKSSGSRPVGDRTNVHLSGGGAVETDDGLDENAEALRQAIEDVPPDHRDERPEDIPVFDRADRLP
ncbi:hypothetical protein [Zavarzinia sp. CC-PAN008]|uniref:hypothetical protein n=1 Tax=Zavarzinia sp. CC-PAN008 TaxID=3243332 RepID=UPI003F743872